jgi:hypothetical protein
MPENQKDFLLVETSGNRPEEIRPSRTATVPSLDGLVLSLLSENGCGLLRYAARFSG